MRAGDLADEWLQALSGPAPAGADAPGWRELGGVATAHATLHPRSRLFEFHEEGTLVQVVAAWELDVCSVATDCASCGDDPEECGVRTWLLTDLVAWQPSEPRRLYRRLGTAPLLGMRGLGAALIAGVPLRLFQTVEDLAAHGGDLGAGRIVDTGAHDVHAFAPAAVVLDLKTAAPLLRDLSVIVADDLDHAEAIQKALRATLPRLPELRVPAQRVAA